MLKRPGKFKLKFPFQKVRGNEKSQNVKKVREIQIPKPVATNSYIICALGL